MSNFVFQSFKYKLGMQKVDWNSTINVWLTPKLTDKSYVNKLSCSDLSFEFFEDKVDWIKVGTINGFNLDSVNKITNESSDSTYEAMEAFPASAYIFSEECPKECWVPQDYEYVAIDSDHYKVAKSTNDDLNKDYWDSNYSFADKYDSTEFEYYNIPEHALTDDMIRLSAYSTDFVPASAFSPGEYKGDGCVITYSEGRTGKDGPYTCYHPICYVEFSKSHGLANGKLKIDWAADGCIQAV